MRILLTGATGFIGRVVARTLVRRGHALRAALRRPVDALAFESVVVGEVGPDTSWSRALEGMDAVVHLAAHVHTMSHDAGAAMRHLRVNAEGTMCLARAAVLAGAKRFVFVSTIKVNGEASAGRPFSAADKPDPRDAYARSKWEAEKVLLEMGGIEPVIIRPPLVHGPGAKGNLARLCRLAHSGWPVPFAGIRNRRDLIAVENLADLVERCVWHPAAAGQVFLAADGQALSTPELYSLIAEALGRRARMFRFPVGLLRGLALPLGLGAEIERLTQSLEIDIRKTRDILGWVPPVSVGSGIAGMARAYASGVS